MPPRRTWSQAEDDKLTSLVTRFGDKRGRESRWHEISKHLPGRTNKVYSTIIGQTESLLKPCQDCRKRWFHSLDPSLRKGRWTSEEDALLLDAYQRLGPAWKEIALISGRKDDQCSKRYNDILNPSVRNRLEDWSASEDRYLTDKVPELGNKCSVIAAGLPGRPPLTCRNRWRKLARVSRARSGGEASSQPQSDSHEPEPLSSTDTPTSTSASVSNSTKQFNDLYTSSPLMGRSAGRIFEGLASLSPVPASGHLDSVGNPDDGTPTTLPGCADSFPVSGSRTQHTASAFHHRNTDETFVPTKRPWLRGRRFLTGISSRSSQMGGAKSDPPEPN
ncbi:hypothetical protein BDW74DRAFT_183430 [Aspergillus multicolor]|uniref:uncharacterized protein n=1 Tax=Aspergillus multicolor TaxID=41759 RepID=UPI003CCE2618